MLMNAIDPKTAAHAIAKIFCDHNYGKIASIAMAKRANSGSRGDPDVLIAKELWLAYSTVYDAAFDQATQEAEF